MKIINLTKEHVRKCIRKFFDILSNEKIFNEDM